MSEADSEQSLQRLLDAVMLAGVAVVVVEILGRLVVGASPEAEAMFGLPLTGRTARELMWSWPSGRVQEILEGRISSYESVVDVRTVDAGHVPLRVWVRAAELEDSPAVPTHVVVTFAPASRRALSVRTPGVAECPPLVQVTSDEQMTIRAITPDVRVAGHDSEEFLGLSVLSLFRPGETGLVLTTIANRLGGLHHVRMPGFHEPEETCQYQLLVVPMAPHPACVLVLTHPDTGSSSSSMLQQLGRSLLPAAPAVNVFDGGDPARPHLSARQAKVLRMILDGKRTPEIAQELFLAPSTVRGHQAAILGKYGVGSRAELIALLHGWPV